MTKYSAKPLSTLLLVVEIGGREMRKEEKVICARDKPHDQLTLDCVEGLKGKNQGEVKTGIFRKLNPCVSRYRNRMEYIRRETVR